MRHRLRSAILALLFGLVLGGILAVIVTLVTLLSAKSVEAQEPGCDTVAFLQMGGNFQFLGDPLEPYVGINAVTEDHTVWHAYIKWDKGWSWEVATGVPVSQSEDCRQYFYDLMDESTAILNDTHTGHPVFADRDLVQLLMAVQDFQNSGWILYRTYMPVVQGGG